jgi:hypothetical protein
MASMAANVNAASPAQQSELVQMLVERVVASGGKVSEREITWTPPARPFFAESGAERWWECPQGALGTRPLSDYDEALAWWVA